jgi:hypothetical protein
MKCIRMSESEDPRFRFKLVDRVAFRTGTGEPSRDDRGVIVEGVIEYEEGGGAYDDRYEVKRDGGGFFGARYFDLIKLEPEGPEA